MAVVHCREKMGRSGGVEKNKNKRYTRVFQLLTDSPTDGAKTVLAYPLLPQLGNEWQQVGAGGLITDTDPDAFCVDRRAEQTNQDHPCDWSVTIEYVGREDPVTEPPEISWSCIKYQASTHRDADGKWVVNSAGDPYEGGITADRTRFVVAIRQNVLFWDPIVAADYLDTLNEQIFLPTAHPPGFLPGLCKLSDFSAEAVWLEDRSAVHYWRRTARIEIDLRGWQAKYLDAGFHEKLDAPIPILGILRIRKPIMMPTGGRPSSPLPLDGEGHELGLGEEPVFNQYAPYLIKDWSGLNLDYTTAGGGL